MKATEDHTVECVARVFFSAACVSADFLYLTGHSCAPSGRRNRPGGSPLNWSFSPIKNGRRRRCARCASQLESLAEGSMHVPTQTKSATLSMREFTTRSAEAADIDG
jgi:hypothetical protein